MHTVTALLGWLPPALVTTLERTLQRIPAVRRRLDREFESVIAGLDPAVHPYRDDLAAYTALPAVGHARSDVLAEMEQLQVRESFAWTQGFVSGAVYNGDAGHIDFLNRVYALNSQSNPLHFDLWPSTVKYEAEIVAMTAAMLGGAQMQPPVVGTVTSGGTESILLAMRTYRDWARARRGIRHPEVIVPTTAHAAFDKAAQYFDLKLVRVPVGPDYRADVAAMTAAITKRTIALVGSAPAFPHGALDPIEALSALALARGLFLHVDACLGGFVLPWAARAGFPVPPFDFRLPGVTSMSADTHKYGYAAKGTSVVLYRGEELRRFQYYAVADWPGGLYFSPTFAGSRPGALSAACWAALVTTGEAGYIEATRSILTTAQLIRAWIAQIPDLVVLGDPLFVIAIGSPTLDIYRVLDYMTLQGWSLNGLHRPPAVHLCVTLRHTAPGVAQRFVDDLRAAVAYVKANPNTGGGMAPIYGMAASMPMHGLVTDLLKRVLDLMYRAEAPAATAPDTAGKERNRS